MIRYILSAISRSILKEVTRHWQPRIIRDRDGKSEYLSRYYLRGRPTMPDGSEPFDRFGNPRDGVQWKGGVGLYVHRFHRSDNDGELHSHPWEWAISLVLAGGYSEERRVGDRVVRARVEPWSLNFLRAEDYHRVDLLEEDAWTLFLVGPKATGWGFWNRETGRVTPWREFFVARQEGAS